MLDVESKDKRKTRYFISAKTLHVVWLEYEEPSESGTPMKFKRTFHDYRYAQARSSRTGASCFEDGKQTQETRILTVTYGSKLDDSLFKTPEA